MIDHKVFACLMNDNTLRVGELQHLALQYNASHNPAIKIKTCYETLQQKIENKPKFVMTLFKDNSIAI